MGVGAEVSGRRHGEVVMAQAFVEASGGGGGGVLICCLP